MGYVRLADYQVPDDQEAAGLPVRNQDQPLTALGFSQLALPGGSAVALTGGDALPAGTTRILVSIETSAARVRFDGTNAAATTGHPLAVASQNWFSLADFTRVSFYSAVASTVNISAFGSVA